MSDEFSLRALCREVWDQFGNCDSAVLTEALVQRIPPHHQIAALEETLAIYTSLFIGGQRRGDARKISLRDRLERRTRRVGDCLIWTGKVASNGYGAITISDHGHRKARQVHRVSYEEFVGPIPPGYQVDHECHSRNPDACPEPCIHVLCWNPEHLRAVTPVVNSQGRRTYRPRKRCRNGHLLTPENIYRAPGTRQVRRCIACRELSNSERVRPAQEPLAA